MKKVLITGARGFIGSHCLEALAERGFQIHAVSSRGRPESGEGHVEWHHADLHNAEHVLRLMVEVKPQYLLHLAWDVTQGIYWKSMENMRWIKSSLSLLQAFVDNGGERALLIGSCAEYDWDYGYCTENLTPVKPGTMYGTCKDALRRVAAAAAGEAGLSMAWARLFFIYGPGEHPDRLVPMVVRSLLRNEEAPCTYGEQVRDYIYVRDAAEALAALLDSRVEGPVNIASGKPVVLKDLIYEAAGKVGRPELVKLGAIAVSADDKPLLLANTSRLREEVGWKPRYSLAEGMAETVSWWRENLKGS